MRAGRSAGFLSWALLGAEPPMGNFLGAGTWWDWAEAGTVRARRKRRVSRIVRIIPSSRLYADDGRRFEAQHVIDELSTRPHTCQQTAYVGHLRADS